MPIDMAGFEAGYAPSDGLSKRSSDSREQAAPFEHPKLAVSVAIPPDARWPERLEKAINSSEQVLEARKIDGGSWEG